MKLKISLLAILFLLSASLAHAFTPIDEEAWANEVKTLINTPKPSLLTKVRTCLLYIPCYKQKLGDAEAFSTISSATIISGFPTIYNDNLAQTVNSSTTSIPQLTVIGTTTPPSAWAGRLIQPTYGGTGSSTLAVNQVLLGGGTTEIRSVSGFGTAGQFLVSQGAGVAPQWATGGFATADNYTVTGQWIFANASTSFISASTTGAISTTTLQAVNIKGASSTVILADVPYGFSSQFPSSASGTVPTSNANGFINFMHPEWELIGETITSGATTTVFATTTLPVRRELMIKIYIPGYNSESGPGLRFNRDGENNYGETILTNGKRENGIDYNSISNLSLIAVDPHATTSAMIFTVFVTNTAESSAKIASWTGSVMDTTSRAPQAISGSGVWNNTKANITEMYLYTCKGNTAFCPAGSTDTFNTGTRISIYGSRP